MESKFLIAFIRGDGRWGLYLDMFSHPVPFQSEAEAFIKAQTIADGNGIRCFVFPFDAAKSFEPMSGKKDDGGLLR